LQFIDSHERSLSNSKPYEISEVPYIKTFKRMAMARVHMQLVAIAPELDGAAVTGAGVAGTGVHTTSLIQRKNS
jgi:hypothetical protein